MKQQIITIAAIALIALTAAHAQTNPSTEQTKSIRIAGNLVNALRSGNTGAVESALRMTALLRLRYPAADLTVLTEEVETVRENHPSGTTRYKAYVVLSFLENPSWYAEERDVLDADEAGFFHAAARRMQHQLLSVNE
ncbi:MAG: hypothetical protein HUU02_02735 [Bacteroidetes bacterium]|nr:hypothetical protein [Bacteroidota bacterium]